MTPANLATCFAPFANLLPRPIVGAAEPCGGVDVIACRTRIFPADEGDGAVVEPLDATDMNHRRWCEASNNRTNVSPMRVSKILYRFCYGSLVLERYMQ